MPFDQMTSKVNWYPGTSKEACDQGYEIVPSEGVFDAKRNAKAQGWNDAAIPMMNTDGDVTEMSD